MCGKNFQNLGWRVWFSKSHTNLPGAALMAMVMLETGVHPGNVRHIVMLVLDTCIQGQAHGWLFITLDLRVQPEDDGINWIIA